MRRLSLTLIILSMLGLGFASPGYAYLDPGSGSILLQGLLAGFAGVIAILKMYWQRIKDFFSKRCCKQPTTLPQEESEQLKKTHHD